ncbi:MAG: mechanosensitive ion channel [Fibrobacter sp.]|jgi:small conductance mechanosensitive channel|nr:mechanosensitive ion channel [Fibrobacter sp.]
MQHLNIFFDWLAAQHAVVQRLFAIFAIIAITFGLLRLLKFTLNHVVKKGMDESAKPLVYSLFSYALYVVALLAILKALNVNTAGIVTMVGAASLAVGLAIKDMLSNIAAGILLLLLKPFKAKDYIECGKIKGIILGVGLFNTTLKTIDGLFVSAPNSKLWDEPIVNFSRNHLRRLEITTGIDYADSADKAIAILQDLVKGDPLFFKEPEPQFFVSSLQDSSVNVTFRAWIKTNDYWDAKWKYTALVKERFTAAGIGIPFPQRTVHIVHETIKGAPSDTANYTREASGMSTPSEQGQPNF